MLNARTDHADGSAGCQTARACGEWQHHITGGSLNRYAQVNSARNLRAARTQPGEINNRTAVPVLRKELQIRGAAQPAMRGLPGQAGPRNVEIRPMTPRRKIDWLGGIALALVYLLGLGLLGQCEAPADAHASVESRK